MDKFFFMIRHDAATGFDLTYFNRDNVTKVIIESTRLGVKAIGEDLQWFKPSTPVPVFDNIIGSNFMSYCLETIGCLRPNESYPEDVANLRAIRWISDGWIVDKIANFEHRINPAHVSAIRLSNPKIIMTMTTSEKDEAPVVGVRFYGKRD